MNIVKDYMLRTLNSVCPGDTVGDVIRFMHKARLSVLPVVDENNRFLGTIYGNNILRNIIPEEYGMINSQQLLYEINHARENLDMIRDRPVEDYMSTRASPVKESDRMNKIAEIMLNNQESIIFVVNERRRLRGYISRADLLCYLLQIAAEKD